MSLVMKFLSGDGSDGDQANLGQNEVLQPSLV